MLHQKCCSKNVASKCCISNRLYLKCCFKINLSAFLPRIPLLELKNDRPSFSIENRPDCKIIIKTIVATISNKKYILLTL